jgi:hypothetical protein
MQLEGENNLDLQTEGGSDIVIDSLEDTFGANPQTSSHVTPNWYYPDNSSYQFDLPPRYVLDEWGDTREGGIYDTPSMPKFTRQYVYGGWTNWVDKFNKDYRFSSQSDMNARATVFPEVHDPWMYTEYLYEGTTQVNDFRNLDENGEAAPQPSIDVGVVEPPLIDPVTVTRAVSGTNAQGNPNITASSFALLNSQIPTHVSVESQAIFSLENQWTSDASAIGYWQSQLEAMGWEETLNDGSTNRAFTRTNTQRRVVKYAVPYLNSGVKLFRHVVWGQSTRWGESSNVPARSLNLTGPRDYFKPNGLFTGRIIPQVTITWGVPIYETLPDKNSQAVIRYDAYGSTAVMRIPLFLRSIGGGSGDPSATYGYGLAPAAPTYTGAIEPDYPRKNVPSLLTWGPTKYGNNDLVHRGCQFWKGEAGTVKCTLYHDNVALYSNLQDTTSTYSDPAAVLLSLATTGHFDTEYEPVVFYTSTNDTTPLDISTVGVKFRAVYTGTSVTSYQLYRDNGVAIKPHADFSGSPGASSFLRLILRRKVAPIPHPTLCGMYDGSKFNENTRAVVTQDAKLKYQQAGGKCPHYTPMGPRILCSYEANAVNGSEWANMQRGLPPGYKKGPLETAAGQTFIGFLGVGPIGAGVPAFMGLAFAATAMSPDPFSSGLPPEESSRIEITYAPELKSLTGKTEYYNTKDGKPHGEDPGGQIRLDPSTNFHALDALDTTALGGVDSTFFGNVNVQNYRVMHNVQHCFRSDKCTSIINSPGGNIGWRRGWFGGLDFTTHPLRMPGYPAGDGKVDGTIKHCFTGDSRCPHHRLDRRAHEYNENYKILLREILSAFRTSGIDAFTDFGLDEFYLTPAGAITTTYDDTYICVAARLHDGSTGRLLGHWQPTVATGPGGAYRIYFYYDRPSFDPFHKHSHVAAHIVQFDDKEQACYMVCPTGKESVWTAVYGNKDTVPWLVELLDDYKEPSGNLVYVTNSKDFAGGRPPEYKDRSKIKHQIMCKRGGYSDRSFREGATDTNQFGGPIWNVGAPAGVTRMGYWVQKEGEWILDGRMIGVGQGFVQVSNRIRNKPGVYGDRWPVHGEPGITIQDKDNPSFDRSGDYATVGWTYSNDTKALIDNFNSGGWQSQLPVDPFTGETIGTLAPNPDVTMLPRERFWYQCSTCGIDFPEEEVNFFLQNSVYPPPSGATGGGVCGCPRRDGGTLVQKGSYERFMKCFGRGEIDIWAPPGTTVKHDGYFWKAPTLISRAHKDQMLRKLGGFNPSGGGYNFSNLQHWVEQLGRLPAATARHYDPGLSHQITAPWAAPGESIATVRARVQSKFALAATDVAYVTEAGTSKPVAVTNETTTLDLGDQVQWLRDYDGDQILVGIPVSAVTSAPTAIMSQSIVQNDTPIPLRSNYGASYPEEKRYQADLRMWIVGVVKDSVQQFSSSVYAEVNAWARQLAQQGVSPSYAEGIDATKPDAPTIARDERVIAPYTDVQDQSSLKFVTIKDMKGMRNRILPTLAYDLTYDTYTAGGDFTDRAQREHLDRFSETRKPMPMPTYGTIAPQILAANDFGHENFAEWDLGDVLETKARAYYPTGMVWWRMNQKVGAIARGGGHNYLHLDESNPQQDHNPYDLKYSGNNVKSVCTLFVHGRMPMHMEILKAYLVFTTEDAPSMEAIGCQGQYTGNVGPRLLDGSIGDTDYRGHSYCFWQHYHGYTTNHEGDKPTPYFGLAAKNHVEIGHNKASYFSDHGTLDNTGTPDVVGPIDWATGEPLVFPELQEIGSDFDYDGNQFMLGDTASLYTQHIAIMGLSFEDTTRGFDFNAQHYFDTWEFGQDLVQTKTEHEIWKDYTYDDFESLRSRYHVNWEAAVDTTDLIVSGEYYGSYFRNYINPKEQQPIPGFMNFTDYDTSDRFSKFVQAEEKVLDNSWATGAQVVVQEGNAGSTANTTDDSGVIADPTGGNGTQQAGSAPKVIDITGKMQALYNDRIDRYFTVKLGAKYADLPALVASRTDTNLAYHDDFHQNYDDPWYFWNYRYAKSGYGLWLNDPWHHVPLAAGVPVTAGTEGDPISQTQADMDARVDDVSDWWKNSLPSTDPNYKKYHPVQLMYADAVLPTTLPPYGSPFSSTRPAPADNPNGWWYVKDEQMFTHHMTWDLRSVPYETSRRPWRFQSPTVDSSNATCPNTSCFVHDRGWTVAQFLQNSLTSWGGYGVVPSTHSSVCANCRTPLVGVTFIDGDGILTVSYADAFEDDVIVSAVEVASDVTTPGSDPADFSHHGFTIEYYNTVVQQWRPLLTVTYNNATSKWGFQQWNGSAWTTVIADNLPNLFVGSPGVAGKPTTSGSHFVAVAAAKLRYKVETPVVVDKTEPNGPFGFMTPNAASGTIVIPHINTVDNPANEFVGRTIVLRQSATNAASEKEMRITEVIGTTDPYTFRMSGVFDNSYTWFQVQWNQYHTRCTKFRVYGFPFVKGEVVITPPGYVQPIVLYPGNNQFRLNNWPTQIFNVTCVVGESVAIPMTEANAPTSSDNFFWTVTDDTFDGVAYKRITAGKWYYDADQNRIIIPSTWLDTGVERSIWELNGDLYADVNSIFGIKTLPSMLTLEYFTGIGMPVEVSAEACGLGPSYQLEPECVQFIVGENDSGAGAIPSGFANDGMPPMGLSVPLKTNGSQRFQLKWHVYNHTPMTWDSKGMSWLVGDELPPQGWGDDKIFNIFTGNGKRMDEINNDGAIRGKASGTVTFYGTPSTMLSGSAVVFAKAYTTKTYSADGQTATTYERTGGFRRGAFTFRLGVADQVSNKRTGIMCGVPKVLVFARERQLDETL